MNIAVTGGRDYLLTQADYQFLERTMTLLRAKAIYTDGGSGVPEQVEAWARRRSIPVHRITANFMHDGPATPEERNTSIIVLVKAVIAFPGGSASDDLVAKARKARRTVHESPERQLASVRTTDVRLRQSPTRPSIRPRLKP